jgi:hypothetical protein
MDGAALFRQPNRNLFLKFTEGDNGCNVCFCRCLDVVRILCLHLKQVPEYTPTWHRSSIWTCLRTEVVRIVCLHLKAGARPKLRPLRYCDEIGLSGHCKKQAFQAFAIGYCPFGYFDEIGL